MPEHAEPDTLERRGGDRSPGLGPSGSSAYVAGHEESFHGRPVAWVAVSTVFAGFVVGGVALVAGPIWVLFWVGVAVALIGGIAILAARVLDDWY